MFDSSVKRGQPAKFPLGNVIKGWTEGLQLMVVGEKRRFWIPGDLAYGDTAGGGRPSGMLVFDVELLGHHQRAQGPRGRRGRAQERQEDEVRPRLQGAQEGHRQGAPEGGRATSRCTTRAGPPTARCSTARSRAASPRRFPLNGVIPGWTEGVQLMVVGEKTRFWIPGELAYDNSPRPGAPEGMLVFDIELLSIK